MIKLTNKYHHSDKIKFMPVRPPDGYGPVGREKWCFFPYLIILSFPYSLF